MVQLSVVVRDHNVAYFAGAVPPPVRQLFAYEKRWYTKWKGWQTETVSLIENFEFLTG